jgi:sugar lactone lactonase YvrE
MSAVITKNRCVVCNKEKASFKCEGCSQTFCYNHVTDHRQELNKQLDEIEVIRDLFRQTLTEQNDDSQKHPLIQQINKWEQDSIKKIQQTADEARQLIFKYTNEHINKIEVKLAKLTDQLRENRQENDFVETDLNQWKKELITLEEDFVKSSNVFIQQDSTPLVNKIFLQVSGKHFNPMININFLFVSSIVVGQLQSFTQTINLNTKWMQNGITIVGGNGQGERLNQLSLPYSIFIDDNQTIYVADCGNDRIVSWKQGEKNGQIVAGGNGKGNRTNQLNGPSGVIADKNNNSFIICDRDNRRVVQWSSQTGASKHLIISNIDCCGLAMDNNGNLYVSDTEKHEVRRWRIGDDHGTIVAGGYGKGDQLNQLNCPIYIFVDQHYSVYVSDSKNHRVMKWTKDAKEGIVVAGGHGKGNSLTQLSFPSGVVVDKLDEIYVTDYGNNRVMRWYQGAKEGTIIVGGNGEGEHSNQFSCPIGLSFDSQGNLYVVERNNHRIQKFEIDLN